MTLALVGRRCLDEALSALKRYDYAADTRQRAQEFAHGFKAWQTWITRSGWADGQRVVDAAVARLPVPEQAALTDEVTRRYDVLREAWIAVLTGKVDEIGKFVESLR